MSIKSEHPFKEIVGTDLRTITPRALLMIAVKYCIINQDNPDEMVNHLNDLICEFIANNNLKISVNKNYKEDFKNQMYTAESLVFEKDTEESENHTKKYYYTEPIQENK